MNKFHQSVSQRKSVLIVISFLLVALAVFIVLSSQPVQAEPPGLIAQIQDAAQRDPSFNIEISVSHTTQNPSVGGRLVYLDDSYICLQPAEKDGNGNLNPYYPSETCVARSNVASITL